MGNLSLENIAHITRKFPKTNFKKILGNKTQSIKREIKIKESAVVKGLVVCVKSIKTYNQYYPTTGIHRTEGESYKPVQYKEYTNIKIGRMGEGRCEMQIKALIFSFIKAANQKILYHKVKKFI